LKKLNKKLVCVSAATQFYTQGAVYQVYIDHEGYQCVRGSDGIYDRLEKMSSRFDKCDENTIG